MRQGSPSYGGIWCALFIIILTLIPSPLPGQVIVQGVTPEKSLQTSKELFSLSGQGFSTGDTIILVGSPPRTRWQIPALDPAKYEQGARMSAIRVRGGRAYVVEDSKTVHILNIENPEQPKRLGTLRDNRFGNINQIWPTDRYLYMTDLNYGIWVADIADPNHPFLVGNGGPNYSFPMPTTIGLYVRGTTIFSTNWQTGLQIIEQIANGQIRSRGSIPISGTPFDIVVNGSLAYVAIGSAVQIFNVGNLDNPAYLSQMTQIPSEVPNIRKLTIKDDVLYLVDRDFGIHIAELVNPAAPGIIASLSLDGQTRDIHITGTFAITANGYKGLQIITLTRKEEPRIFGNIYTHGDATAIAPYPGYLYVANGLEGLGIIETPSLAHPALLASFPTGDYPWAIACKEGFAYLSNGRSGLRVIQTAQPRLPRIVSTIPTAPQTATFSSVSGNTLYVADSTRFRTYDISDPSTPLLLGSLALNDIIMSLLIQGNYAYLANFGFGVKSVDISKPGTPLLRGSAYSPSSWGLASDIDIDQGIAYVANGPAGLWIVDFQNPLFPFTISTLEQFTTASNIEKYQHLIYMANGSSGTEVIDVSDPADPVPVVTMNYNEFLNGIDIKYPFLYTAGDTQGVWINYLSPDGEIIPIAPINLPGGALAVKSFGEFLYCGDGENYFSIFSTPAVAEILPESSDSSRLYFRLNRDLPPGDYDIYLLKESGDLYSLLRGLSVYQDTVTFVPGLNIMGYPGYVPAENNQAFSLLANLAEQGEGGTLTIKKIMALINTGASSGSFLRTYLNQSNQPAGDNFDIHPLRGYPLYAMGTQEQGYLLANHPLALTQEELMVIIKDEISPGRNLIAMPAMEGGGIAVESLFRPDGEDAVSSIHEWNPVKGTWNATYLFFGRVTGKVKELKAGRGYLVCAH